MLKSFKMFPAFTFGLFGFIFFHLAKEMLQVRSDGWYVGQINLYGDLVFHIGLINKFLQSDKVIISSPIYAGTKPNYPIFEDFITAQIAKITSIDWALFITTFLVGILAIYTARLFIKYFFKNEKIIFLSLLLFFLNGGFGFIYFFQDYVNSNISLFSFIFNMPNQYTDIKEKGYWWINNYLAYFLPQRALLFAFPITLTVIILLYRGVKSHKTSYFFLAGILSGILPIIQAHSLFVLALLSSMYAPISFFTSKSRKLIVKSWSIYLLTTIILALPLFKAISSAENITSFFRFAPGFTSKEDIVFFWFKNLGLFGPMLIISILWIYRKNKELFLLYLPFLALFVISNLFVFQPWEFDNTKIMIYWYFASCILVAYFLYDQLFTEGVFKKILASFLVFFMIFSGSLDIFRTFTKVTSYQIFSNTDLQIAQSVKNLTPKDALFVTASNHNNPIPALSGRSTLLGFHGWVWSHGLPYQQRASDVEWIYQGGEQADLLIKRYKINFVTISPEERASFKLNENYFKKFPQIYLSADWSIYDVSSLWADNHR